jgi:hypothetical protein
MPDDSPNQYLTQRQSPPLPRRPSFSGSTSKLVTPSDTLVQPFSALHNATSTPGNISITDTAGNVSTFYVAAGGYVTCAGTKVMATNTAVTAINAIN